MNFGQRANNILSLFTFYQASTFGCLFLSIPWVPVIIFISKWQRWALLMFIYAKNSAKKDIRVLTVLRTKNPLHSNEYVTVAPPPAPLSHSHQLFRVFVCVYSPLLVFITHCLSLMALCLFSGWIAPRTYAWDTEFSECWLKNDVSLTACSVTICVTWVLLLWVMTANIVVCGGNYS